MRGKNDQDRKREGTIEKEIMIKEIEVEGKERGRE